MTRKLCSLILCGLLTLPLSACAAPLQYSAEPIEAWVVDAETKQPLEGVIVVANWALESTSRIIPHQTNAAGSLMILETVTDKNGRFHFPAWGPKWHLGSGDLTDSDPELIFFKSDYKYITVSNSRYTRPAKHSDEGKLAGTESKPVGSKRISFWSGETIKMERFRGTVGEYVRHVSSFAGNLRFIEDDCQWKIVPRMILELQKQLDVFKAAGIVTAFYSVDYLPMNKENEAKCGSPKEFFKGYLK